MQQHRPRLLVIRLSSIGDIVLTTPVLRSIKRARPEIELHYVTRASYAQALEGNQWIDRLHLYAGRLTPLLATLRGIGFDYVLDLHANPRSLALSLAAGGRRAVFEKRNLDKLRIVYGNRTLAVEHVVQRYGETLQLLNLTLDDGGLEFPLGGQDRKFARALLRRRQWPARYRCIALGATHNTKKWLDDKIVELGCLIAGPLVLLGGRGEGESGRRIAAALQTRGVRALNLCGQTDLKTSAAIMDGAVSVVTHDTGLMHIAAALQRPLVSLWGSTSPRFGMGPYRCTHRIVQAIDLECRPCHKLGYAECPRGHFRCMGQIGPDQVYAALCEAEAQSIRRPSRRNSG
ncbi:MAG: glycosyltransferase family 9 protein [Leptospirales bacterium]|nr:glycosyltransferase family 9 protein [Leptospirales bacterium]